METTYYNLNARKVKVSGGADFTTFVPVAVPEPAVQEPAEVLDFDRYRQRLETKSAWRELTAPQAEVAPTARRQRSHPSKAQRRANALELVATAAVILVSLTAIAAFIALV